jgi:hypothetical protein
VRSDPHEAGQIYPVDLADVAAKWGVDAFELRKALNIASLPYSGIEIMPRGKLRDDLLQFATAANKFAEIIEHAEDQIIYRVWAGLPEIHPGNLKFHLDTVRRCYASEIRRLANQAMHNYRAIKVTRKPSTTEVTVRERAIVDALASVWLRSTGQWPTVYNKTSGDGTNDRQASRGGRFVIETAKILDLHLTVQRLRTVLDTLPPPAET